MIEHTPQVRATALVDLLNQIHDIDKKLARIEQPNSIARNVRRMREVFEAELFSASLTYTSPLGEAYDETRTDCEASIGGTSADGLVITEVIKPMIYVSQNGVPTLIQKAVVIAEAPSHEEDVAPETEGADAPELAASETDPQSAQEHADTTTPDTLDA